MIVPRVEQWKAQWHRVIRWHKRLADVQRKSLSTELDVNDIDFVISFFQNCYHLRDWLQACHPNLQTQVNSLFSDNFEMAACRDICNGFKHKALTNPSLDADFSLYREYDYFAKTDGAQSRIKYNAAFTDGDDIRKCDIFALAQRCFQLWEDFIRQTLKYSAADVSSFL